MWDSPSNGTFFFSSRDRVEYSEKILNLSIEELKRFILLYERWKEDGHYDPLHHFVCQTIKDDFSKNALSSFDECMKLYDFTCRELASRWALNKLDEPK